MARMCFVLHVSLAEREVTHGTFEQQHIGRIKYSIDYIDKRKRKNNPLPSQSIIYSFCALSNSIQKGNKLQIRLLRIMGLFRGVVFGALRNAQIHYMFRFAMIRSTNTMLEQHQILKKGSFYHKVYTAPASKSKSLKRQNWNDEQGATRNNKRW
eukprot:1692229-Amphidinium_carterae.1